MQSSAWLFLDYLFQQRCSLAEERDVDFHPILSLCFWMLLFKSYYINQDRIMFYQTFSLSFEEKERKKKKTLSFCHGSSSCIDVCSMRFLHPIFQSSSKERAYSLLNYYMFLGNLKYVNLLVGLQIKFALKDVYF